jgi:hypothetical protein
MARNLKYGALVFVLSAATVTLTCCKKTPDVAPGVAPDGAKVGVPNDSPVEVVGGTIHVCTASPITETANPYTVTVDTTTATLHGVLFKAGDVLPDLTKGWTLKLSSLDNKWGENKGTVILTPDLTTPLTIDITVPGGVWKHDKSDFRTLKFHDENSCPGDSEGSRCDHLVNVEASGTAPGGGPADATGQCLGGVCKIVIGTEGNSHCD